MATSQQKDTGSIRSAAPMDTGLVIPRPQLNSASASPIAKPFQPAITDTATTSTITPVIENPLIDYRIFKEHELKVEKYQVQFKSDPSADWMLAIVIGTFLFYAILNVFYTKALRKIFPAFLANRLASQILREENILFQRLSLLLFLPFILLVSVLCYKITAYYQVFPPSVPDAKRYLIILGLSIAAPLLKILAVRVIGFVLKIKEIREYNFNIMLFNNITGMLLFPVIVILALLPGISEQNWFIVSAGIFSIMFLYRTLRTFIAGLSLQGVSPFYLFLYLCTLEFLPLAVIIKLLVNKIQ